jgi:hypothetical protein
VKYIILIVLLIATVSCTSYKAKVRVESCIGKIDTLDITYCQGLQIITEDQAVPILQDFNGIIFKYNACDFTILSQTEIKQ